MQSLLHFSLLLSTPSLEQKALKCSSGKGFNVIQRKLMWSQGWLLFSLKPLAVAVLAGVRWDLKHYWETQEQRAGWKLEVAALSSLCDLLSSCWTLWSQSRAQWYGSLDLGQRCMLGGDCCHLCELLIHPVPSFPQTLLHITMGGIAAGAPPAGMQNCLLQTQFLFPGTAPIIFKTTGPVFHNHYSIFARCISIWHRNLRPYV